MPKIPPDVLDAAFFLYDTEEDAKAGLNPQGTGFIVGCPSSEVHGFQHFYGVTNWHVAIRDDAAEGIKPSPVVRLNKKYGGETFVKTPEWHSLKNGPDVAVAYFDFLERDDLQWNFVSLGIFAEVSAIQSGNVAVGDDAFMLGLFLDHDAVATNVPGARFGNISMLPSTFMKIEQENGFMGECYIVDMHSRSGFSGSPVFMYRMLGHDLSRPLHEQFRILPGIADPRFGSGGIGMPIRGDNLFLFLGIHVGQFPEDWKAGKSQARMVATSKGGLKVDDAYVEGWSGMTCVIPAWQLRNVIEKIPEFQPMRDLKDSEFHRRKRGKLVSDKSAEKSKKDDANPNHLKDFKRLVDVAARKRPQDDQT